ncbi:MAG: zinc ABC transporter substrate-binding protein [Acidobacteria bacterium]|nr:zinc ABC transporter substrate-binding protein [Acidobacteriota bacterium]
MKRTLVLALALVAGSVAQAEPLNVVTTTSDLASIAREVGGDRVAVESIARGYQDPHFVEAKPSFLLQLRKAELLAVVGLELEIGWLPPLIEQSRNSEVRPGTDGYLDLSAGVEILDRPSAKVDRSMGDIHASGNPHYWLEPGNAVRIAIQFRDRFAKLRPAEAPYFTARLNEFKVRANDANKRWTEALAPYKGAKIVTYHRSWSNFARRYGLDVVDFVEPKPGVPPSPSHLFELVQSMKEQKVKVILVEPYFDLKTPNSVAQKTGAKVIVMYPSVGGAPGLDDYFKLFDRNVSALAEGLR